MGADAYTEDPYVADPEFGGRGEGGPVYPGYGNISDPSRGCTANGTYSVCDPDISFWRSNIADLPGFGTNWGSFSQLGEWEYEARLAFTRAQLEARRRKREGAPHDSETLPQNPQNQGLNADEIQEDFYNGKYGKSFNDCLQEVFGKDVPVTQTLANAPVLNTSETSQTLKTRVGVETRGTVVGTIVAPRNGKGGAIKISEGAAYFYGTNRANDAEALMTYAHELAKP